ncbi:MAG: tRNA (N6-isopentenyl adenosine(37)-C2)-methylthiotransferase MiaB [Bacteroidetes bacterium CG2_30_33_31]|nr:MAG: tRNA (N6-isopentenyl adenosine(37)-C2)-methylthiotransferase MiaB [Bacteroidetes bacterium CG2_30_33_31]
MKKLFVETYGCQMNVADSEVVASIMINAGYELTQQAAEADVIFVNTCSIRDNAEKRVRNRIQEFKALKRINPQLKVGILGCMAERLKNQLLEEEIFVDLIAGPDAYRNLPEMINQLQDGRQMANVVLSLEETYDDISPVRLDKNGVSAFISIMRGCDNYCAYCVVPFTRGHERSRNPQTIVAEAMDLISKGYKEVTLLGQNVNSYHWSDSSEKINFSELLKKVAAINPNLRVRFSTSHPKDISDELIETIAETPNICNSIHLPVQSGNNEVLKRMKRFYTREWYLDRIALIKKLIPDCGLSTDIIAGFCGETEEEHQDTVSLMKEVGYDYAFMFMYSERPDTLAAKKLDDDVEVKVKNRRLQEIIEVQQASSLANNKKDLGKIFSVLVEAVSKRSKSQFSGRTDQNKVMVFETNDAKIGDYVRVRALSCTAATMIGEIVE